MVEPSEGLQLVFDKALGDAKKLIGSHNTSPTWGYKTPDHAVAMIAFKNGSVGTISASTGLTPGKGRLEFYGDDGYIIIEGGLLGEEGSLTTGITNFRKTKSGHGTTRIAKEKTTILSATNTYRLQVEAFGDTITRGRSYPLTPEDGLANIKLISAARGW